MSIVADYVVLRRTHRDQSAASRESITAASPPVRVLHVCAIYLCAIQRTVCYTVRGDLIADCVEVIEVLH